MVFFLKKLKFCLKFCFLIANDFYGYLITRFEISRIRSLKRYNIKSINIIYDLSVSPLTYGDFYVFLFLCRFYITEGYKVNFFLLEEINTNNDKNLVDLNFIEFFVKNLKIISSELLDKKNCSIFSISWELFTKHHINKSDEIITLFEKRVFKRKSLYNLAFKMLDTLFKTDNKKHIKHTLLNQDFKSKGYKKIDFDFAKDYVTWGLRFNKNYGFDRNNSKEEFIETYKLIKKFFPKKDIIVICDKIGTEHFRNISVKHNLHVSFSKDYSQGFMEDALFILNSKLHLQFKGGASSMVAIFSNVKYLIFGNRNNERILFRKNLSTWQMEGQVFIPIKTQIKFNKFRLETELKNFQSVYDDVLP